MIEYLSQPEISKEIALDAAFWAEPWRTSTFEPEVWNNKWPDDVEYGQNLARVMEATLEIGVPDLQIPGQDEYVKALDAEIAAVLTGEKELQQALDDAAAEWDAITDRLGREEQIQYWNTQYDALKARGIEYRPEIAE
jgi:multiple sugar transport system substrate-binding protein